MRDDVTDAFGNPIYLTQERWEHICDEHPEMESCREELLESLRHGGRFQDSVRPDVYLYCRDHANLPHGNTTIVVAVRFGI